MSLSLNILRLLVAISLIAAAPVASHAQQACEQEEEGQPRLAVKTNLLSDCAAIPGLGVELCMGNNFSLSADWAYAWWNRDASHFYWSTYGGDAAIRYWLGRERTATERLTGHHIGLYGQMATFDFELGRRGYQAADWAYAGGIEYGWACAIGKRLNLDLVVGAGYLNGVYKEYLPIDTHYVWQRTVAMPHFCLTKAEVSLVWIIKRKEKGGAR